MRVLILGSGGREHALAWKIAQSPLLDKLFIAPGNPGSALVGQNIDLDIDDFDSIGNLALKHQISMIIVGPEGPLVNGIWDYFQQQKLRHIKVIGPSQAGAELEGSKSFAKEFMREFNIPTAQSDYFDTLEIEAGCDYIDEQEPPIVIKADGLAGGKGVLIINDPEEAKLELAAMLHGKFGSASANVVVEEYLTGIEFSVFVITDGKDYHVLPVAKDYKRIGEGDTGLNTGGMGAISHPPFVTDQVMQEVKNTIIEPTIKGLGLRQMPYTGFIFFGLILVEDDPFVIEYNCRLGDPETQSILPRLEGDLLELLASTGTENFKKATIQWSEKQAVTTILASEGYPESYEKSIPIDLSKAKTSTEKLLFFSGTKRNGPDLLTNGGRVLSCVALDNDPELAREQSQQLAAQVRFKGKYYRHDIGQDVL